MSAEDEDRLDFGEDEEEDRGSEISLGFEGEQVGQDVEVKSNGSPKQETKVPEPAAETPLPEGWARRYSRNGEVYYLNTVTNQSTWDEPTGPAAAQGGTSAQDPVLPAKDNSASPKIEAQRESNDKALEAAASTAPRKVQDREEVPAESEKDPHSEANPPDDRSRDDNKASTARNRRPLPPQNAAFSTKGSSRSYDAPRSDRHPTNQADSREDKRTSGRAQEGSSERQRGQASTAIPTGPRSDRQQAGPPTGPRALRESTSGQGVSSNDARSVPTGPAASRTRPASKPAPPGKTADNGWPRRDLGTVDDAPRPSRERSPIAARPVIPSRDSKSKLPPPGLASARDQGWPERRTHVEDLARPDREREGRRGASRRSATPPSRPRSPRGRNESDRPPIRPVSPPPRPASSYRSMKPLPPQAEAGPLRNSRAPLRPRSPSPGRRRRRTPSPVTARRRSLSPPPALRRRGDTPPLRGRDGPATRREPSPVRAKGRAESPALQRRLDAPLAPPPARGAGRRRPESPPPAVRSARPLSPPPPRRRVSLSPPPAKRRYPSPPPSSARLTDESRPTLLDRLGNGKDDVRSSSRPLRGRESPPPPKRSRYDEDDGRKPIGRKRDDGMDLDDRRPPRRPRSLSPADRRRGHVRPASGDPRETEVISDIVADITALHPNLDEEIREVEGGLDSTADDARTHKPLIRLYNPETNKSVDARAVLKRLEKASIGDAVPDADQAAAAHDGEPAQGANDTSAEYLTTPQSDMSPLPQLPRHVLPPKPVAAVDALDTIKGDRSPVASALNTSRPSYSRNSSTRDPKDRAPDRYRAGPARARSRSPPPPLRSRPRSRSPDRSRRPPRR